MKLLTLLLCISATAVSFATSSQVAEDKEQINLARVEKVLSVGKPGPRLAIRLVQVDNGGSTDMSSVYSPSSVYLTLFNQGEDYDKAVSYPLAYNVASDLKLESLDQTNGIAIITYKAVGESGDVVPKTVEIDSVDSVKVVRLKLYFKEARDNLQKANGLDAAKIIVEKL